MRSGIRLVVACSVLLASFAACAGPESLRGRPAVPAEQLPSQAAFVAVEIEFEPPLPTVGELHIQHESGWQHRCKAAPSGVDVRMPEGPASMRLQVAGEHFELTIKAMANDAPHVWRR